MSFKRENEMSGSKVCIKDKRCSVKKYASKAERRHVNVLLEKIRKEDEDGEEVNYKLTRRF
jgi:hypothetical protein